MHSTLKGLMSYSGLTTKIHAMSGRLLTEEDLKEIVALPDVSAVVRYLKERRSYAQLLQDIPEEKLHRGMLEPVLRESVYRDFTKLYRFANAEQQSFLKKYFMRYEVLFLKECLTNIFDPRDRRLDLSVFEKYFRRYSRLPFQALTGAETPVEFVGLLAGTDYYEPMSRALTADEPTLFDFEMMLDLFHFGELWKVKASIVTRSEIDELTQILGSKFDMLNILWLQRCKKYYHLSPAEIYALLIPVNYRLKKSEIRAMVEADTPEAVRAVINGSYYARRYDDVEADTLEASYARIMKTILTHESRHSPYSVATIYSYLYHKEHEVDRLIIALECVRYRIPTEVALAHVVTR